MEYKDYERQNHGVSWREYVDLRFEEAEKVLSIARIELDRRLEGMNELRSQIDKRDATFVTRDYLDIALEKVDSRLSSLEAARASSDSTIRVYATIISLVTSIVASTLVGALVYFLVRR